MEKRIKEFDIMLKKYSSNYFSGKKIAGYFFLAGYLLLSIVPITEVFEEGLYSMIVILFDCMMFATVGMYFIVLPYLKVESEEKTVGIYNILKYTPCLRQAFINSRVKLLLRKILPFSVIAIALRIVFYLTGLINAGLLDILYMVILYIIWPIACSFVLVYTMTSIKKAKD